MALSSTLTDFSHILSRHDGDGDGSVNLSEFEAAVSELRSRVLSSSNASVNSSSSSSSAVHNDIQSSKRLARAWFAVLDRNRDGRVTIAESLGMFSFLPLLHEKKNSSADHRQPGEEQNQNQDVKRNLILASTSLPSSALNLLVGPRGLQADHVEDLVASQERLLRIASAAHERRCKLFVDAEQTYFQPAIDHMALDLMRVMNRYAQNGSKHIINNVDPNMDSNPSIISYIYSFISSPNSSTATSSSLLSLSGKLSSAAASPISSLDDSSLVFNTYQLYLKDGFSRMQQHAALSDSEGWSFAAKLVRGAYMVSERARAQELGQPSPIQDTKQDTHAAYDRAVAFMLQRFGKPASTTHETAHGGAVMIATHNADSIHRAVALSDSLGIPKNSSQVAFGQLYGMCDALTGLVAAEGRPAFKYLPYGTVGEVIPYLIRRAQENSDVLGGAAEDRRLLWEEIRRRFSLVFQRKD